MFQPDASVCGGILACMEIAAAARRRGIAVYPHVGGPTIIGLAANLHWAVAADVDVDGVRHRSLPAARRRLRQRSGSATSPAASSPRPTRPVSACRLPDDVAERFPYEPGDTYADVFPDHETGASKA